MASLDGPIAKFNRAREHVETLRRNLEPFRDLNSYVIASDIDDETGEQIRRFDAVPPMPTGLEVIIGEMLYNLRCSLDHLVWQLDTWSQSQVKPRGRSTIVDRGLGRASDIQTDAPSYDLRCPQL